MGGSMLYSHSHASVDYDINGKFVVNSHLWSPRSRPTRQLSVGRRHDVQDVWRRCLRVKPYETRRDEG